MPADSPSPASPATVDPVALDTTVPSRSATGRWLVLIAALLGWMFDGLEMGLFPLVARPALLDLMDATGQSGVRDVNLAVNRWIDVITASFLVGAATGGVVFGWLGDRIGRVRAMTLSVVVYSLFTGVCGLAETPEQIALFRFIGSLGMGGEWALGVALVMEVWKVKSRGLLAGLIGAAANVGYLIIGIVGIGLTSLGARLGAGLGAMGLAPETVEWLTRADGWRILMIVGATPALLALLVRLFVPESESWQKEHAEGRTSHWATRDLLAVLAGACGPGLMIGLLMSGWKIPAGVQVVVVLAALAIACWGYLFPVVQYLGRSEAAGEPQPAASGAPAKFTRKVIVGRMLLAAGLSGLPLLTTWACVQRLPAWADKLAETRLNAQLDGLEGRTDAAAAAERDAFTHAKKTAKAETQSWSAVGAIVGTLVGAMLGDMLGRRITYALLCLVSMAAVQWVWRVDEYGSEFLLAAFFAGAATASFYGWLPLYLPELFPTRVRATGQGFGFNFGRILAAVGTLQFSAAMRHFEVAENTTVLYFSAAYVLGIALLAIAPETHGEPLPD